MGVEAHIRLQYVSNGVAKGHILSCKRCPFGLQKGIFCVAFVMLLTVS